MAMALPSERRRHYNWDSFMYRHWQYLAKRCGIADRLDALIAELKAATPAVVAKAESLLRREFPAAVADPTPNSATSNSPHGFAPSLLRALDRDQSA
jgi:hypothetical protein